jgi:hypothetical protein
MRRRKKKKKKKGRRRRRGERGGGAGVGVKEGRRRNAVHAIPSSFLKIH